MHRTPGTILATSRNKAKTFFPSPLLHTGERVQQVKTSFTNPLPLLHTGEEESLPTPSYRRKSLHWVPRYGKPHTTFNSTKSFQARQNTPNIQPMRITYYQ